MSSLDRYTGSRYVHDNPTWHEEDSPWKAGLVAGLLSRQGLRPRTILEVGSGSGRVLEELHRMLPDAGELVGYEPSPDAFQMCQAREHPGLRFVCGTLSEVEPGKRYDLGLAMDVFEHVEDFYGFLRAFRGHSDAQVFHIPLDVSVQTVLRAHPFAFRRTTIGHIHFFTKETALAALADCGYEVVEAQYTLREGSSLTPKARLARQLRRVPFRLHQDLTVRILGGYSLLVLTR